MARQRRAWLARIKFPVWGRTDGPDHFLLYAELTSDSPSPGRTIEVRISKEQVKQISNQMRSWAA